MAVDIPVKEIKKWVRALRSGKYKQTRLVLQDKQGYCCLGVACKTFIPKHKQIKNSLFGTLVGGMVWKQPHAPLWLKEVNEEFARITGTSLIMLNDDGMPEFDFTFDFTFDEIADLLELVFVYKAFQSPDIADRGIM